ncbi:class I SAM-dependent methyltransferase [Zooshikella ganghwensis]|uniref:class I SAM-dependent methyltransferase n=1 Tax=Zooshikella ganghwensis TaxID=202772 RepID=UPI0004294B7D|nr:class I SAM-dependent methyltransferase [Zooshikella ganghwensis]
MKRIEEVSPKVTPELYSKIYEFWSNNVNSEKIYGSLVTNSERGSEQYFQELESQRYRSHRHLLPWIHSMKPGKTVLEIGCGIGLDSYQLVKHGMKLTAIDLTNIAIEIASSRFKASNIEGNFFIGDATSLQFDDNSFDYVYSFGVLHHVQDTEKAIIEVYRVLKQGGIAKVMLYNLHSLNELIHRLTLTPFEDKNELCPVVRRFSKKEASRLFYKFNRIDIKKDFVYGEGYGRLFKYTPLWLYKKLSSIAGWHLMITAYK